MILLLCGLAPEVLFKREESPNDLNFQKPWNCFTAMDYTCVSPSGISKFIDLLRFALLSLLFTLYMYFKLYNNYYQKIRIPP